MDVKQVVTDDYAIYNADCIDIMNQMHNESIDLSIYSPPFGGLYQYSSSDRDLSNCDDYGKFFEQYDFVINQIHRLTKPGRITAVHCTDIPKSNAGGDEYIDFSGDIIKAHEKNGLKYAGRYAIWKEPLSVRNRTYMKSLMHQTVIEDSIKCSNASADWLLIFRKRGTNKIPVIHENGFEEYIGEREIPVELLSYKGWRGKQIENKLSHWIWRQYASAFWDDIRINRVMPFKSARESDEEKHVHPLQLDVIERCCILWSNPGETVLTPFLGVGSEVYGALNTGRKGIGIELKESYFKQAVKNLSALKELIPEDQQLSLFEGE